MSAIDELRRQLTEVGVEWKTWNGVHPITVWRDETYLYEFVEYGLINDAKQVGDCPSNNDGYCELTIKVFNCTPAQAIAATVGPQIVYCNDCAYFDTRKCKSQWPFRFNGFCAWGERRVSE